MPEGSEALRAAIATVGRVHYGQRWCLECNAAMTAAGDCYCRARAPRPVWRCPRCASCAARPEEVCSYTVVVYTLARLLDAIVPPGDGDLYNDA